VHTLGTLLEDAWYKDALRRGDALGALASYARAALLPGGRNPLAADQPGSYEQLNRDAGACSVGLPSTTWTHAIPGSRAVQPSALLRPF